MSNPPPLLLGHRGARAIKRVRENTPASFDLALKHGCHGFEFDVRRSGCGTAVICHDATVDGVPVAKTECQQAKRLPTLEAVLARYSKRAFLDIELKVEGLESLVILALNAHPPEKGCVVSSFLPEVLIDLMVRGAGFPLGFICDKQKQLNRWRDLPAEYVIPHFSLITPKLVEAVHKAERLLIAWTVNTKRSMLQLAEWGVDGIISDQTERLVKTLS